MSEDTEKLLEAYEKGDQRHQAMLKVAQDARIPTSLLLKKAREKIVRERAGAEEMSFSLCILHFHQYYDYSSHVIIFPPKK